MPPEQQKLMDLYRLHSEEVRFNVQLNWDRAKSSLAFHATLLALIATLDKLANRYFTVALFLFTGLSCLLGGRIIKVGHEYYRAARDQRREVERALGLEVRLETTPGARGEVRKGWKWVTVTRSLIVMHVLLGALAFAGAYIYAQR